MASYLLRFLKLILGLFLYGLGIVITMKANVGYAPWEVLHSGISQTLGISIGIVNTVMGGIIVAIAFFMGEKIGLGTLLNMVMIGFFMDLIFSFNLIPSINHFGFGIVLLILGLFIISLGTYFYISSGFGAGPRDSLMVAVTRKTGFSLGLCRGILELSIVIIGFFLGSPLGIGTIISAFCIGFCIQLTFKAFHFDPTQSQHESFSMMIKNIKAYKKGD